MSLSSTLAVLSIFYTGITNATYHSLIFEFLDLALDGCRVVGVYGGGFRLDCLLNVGGRNGRLEGVEGHIGLHLTTLILDVQLQRVECITERLLAVLDHLDHVGVPLEVEAGEAQELYGRGESQHLALDRLVRLVQPVHRRVQGPR